MTESEFESPKDDTPSAVSRIWSGWQWLVAAVLGLIALLFALVNDNLSAPGAPVAGYWSSVVAFALVAILLCPPAFFRLPKVGKWLTYIAILPALIFLGSMLGQVQEAYERTPKGAKVAAERNAANVERAKAEAREAEAQTAADKEKAETADLLAKAEAEGEKLEEIMEQQENCLSWGQLKDLNRMVRDSLHNPDSFEHVSTEFIVPTADRHNVLLTFRAENGFAATRTARVTASMIPESCEILEVGEPQPL